MLQNLLTTNQSKSGRSKCDRELTELDAGTV